MDLEFFKRIKRLVLIAVCSDDYLVDKLVLKGGNAMSLIYDIANRASLDLDFSIDTSDSIPEDLEYRLKASIAEVFRDEGYQVIDWKFNHQPKNLDADRATFWGGYSVEFKIIDLKSYIEYKDSPLLLSARAASLVDQRKKFEIDISNFEYCKEPRRAEEIEGYTIYVYSPEMIVFEKLRALCQQMPEYLPVVGKSKDRQKPRARDFYDIYVILELLRVNIYTEENIQLLLKIFGVKRVDISLLRRLRDHQGFHATAFPSLRDTVTDPKQLKDFDFYFDYVIDVTNKLEALRVK
jgi:predicted nucleotidyltransferase component of viral defense system